MVRTQVQLPDQLHHRLKLAATHEEASLAEIIRRAGEYFLAVHPEIERTSTHWEPPPGRDLGRLLAPESRWRELANEPSDEELRMDPEEGR